MLHIMVLSLLRALKSLPIHSFALWTCTHSPRRFWICNALKVKTNTILSSMCVWKNIWFLSALCTNKLWTSTISEVTGAKLWFKIGNIKYPAICHQCNTSYLRLYSSAYLLLSQFILLLIFCLWDFLFHMYRYAPGNQKEAGKGRRGGAVILAFVINVRLYHPDFRKN